ncbi:ExbD/TolR family protein [Aliiglaciecola lipolytica]|uniref:Biopolymer transport protein n=1 Tax=Aliiglaciecola lipolytica E3 TaxID=1127673 RepID=K6YBJ0_9ALTE|nr:biopolymer transporter ExbD [Aliiglaciecola lipolytica]GAC15562.1 biopolymer transport protein [Aliiglaciecola lipolytica E3]
MKKSVRASRMERHHKRMAKTSKLSLVSLMDIFTILVFFLMFNASDVQVLQTDKSVKLPESTAETAAQETLVLLVNAKHILLQGQRMADVAQVMSQPSDIIPALEKELTYQKNRTKIIAVNSNEEQDPSEIARAITIMGDQAIPYSLLKKIMQTCAQAGYTNISLAVEQQLPAKGEE